MPLEVGFLCQNIVPPLHRSALAASWSWRPGVMMEAVETMEIYGQNMNKSSTWSQYIYIYIYVYIYRYIDMGIYMDIYMDNMDMRWNECSNPNVGRISLNISALLPALSMAKTWEQPPHSVPGVCPAVCPQLCTGHPGPGKWRGMIEASKDGLRDWTRAAQFSWSSCVVLIEFHKWSSNSYTVSNLWTYGFNGIFPYKPSSYGGNPLSGTPHIFKRARHRDSTNSPAGEITLLPQG